ncbi:MAG: Lrp/AsnC family transcriptional regulator [Nitrososphaeraceae archaeon]|nr:Lrp/AsnC family transcriptional regulator [Nitrososphaeraceae archaeon]
MIYDKPAKKSKVYNNYSNNNDNNSNNSNNDNKSVDVQSHLNTNTYAIDDLDQKLLELILKGYENKKIATEVKTPLSTIQRRIKKITENQYISRKNELNYKKLGLRKGYLQISIRGDKSYEVVEKLTGVGGIIAISEVTGNFDILCTCIFRDTDDLFRLLEKIKTIERVQEISWSEEVRFLEIEEKLASLSVSLL